MLNGSDCLAYRTLAKREETSKLRLLSRCTIVIMSVNTCCFWRGSSRDDLVWKWCLSHCEGPQTLSVFMTWTAYLLPIATLAACCGRTPFLCRHVLSLPLDSTHRSWNETSYMTLLCATKTSTGTQNIKNESKDMPKSIQIRLGWYKITSLLQ